MTQPKNKAATKAKYERKKEEETQRKKEKVQIGRTRIKKREQERTDRVQ